MIHYNPNVDLVHDECAFKNLVKFYPFILKILSKKQFLTSIKGCNSAGNLQKMKLYNPKLDLVDDVYTKSV